MKPKAQFIITVPKPCTEDWAQMTPADKGRFCASCQKTVVDFTVLTDAEIVAYMKRAKGQPGCGHFFASQLDRVLVEKREPSRLYELSKRVAAAFLLLQATVSTALAQGAKQKQDTTKSAGSQAQEPTIKYLTGVNYIKGRVLDYSTKGPVPGISVQIKGLKVYAVTDKAGRFKLALPEYLPMAGQVIQGQMVDTTNENGQRLAILDEQVTDEHKGVTLYRFPLEEVKPIDITTYRMEERYVQQGGVGLTIGGGRNSEVTNPEIKKRTLWQRIFHAHKKQKES